MFLAGNVILWGLLSNSSRLVVKTRLRLNKNNNGFLFRKSNATKWPFRNGGYYIRDRRCRILICFWSRQETRRGLEWLDVPKMSCLMLTFLCIVCQELAEWNARPRIAISTDWASWLSFRADKEHGRESDGHLQIRFSLCFASNGSMNHIIKLLHFLY